MTLATIPNVYDIGDSVRLSVTFTVGTTPTDPTTITAKVRNAAGTVTTYTYAAAQITKDSTGVYHLDITVNLSGTWVYRFEGTGTCIAAIEQILYVEPSAFY